MAGISLLRKIAFLGSRTWQDAQRVALQVNSCFSEHGQFILVSGGADGASKVAEETGNEFGLPVCSFRAVQVTSEEFAVDEWRMHRGRVQIIRHEPDFADWKSAAYYRSMLIAERADEGFAYWDGYSRGTSGEIELFDVEDKPLHIANLRLEQGGMK